MGLRAYVTVKNQSSGSVMLTTESNCILENTLGGIEIFNGPLAAGESKPSGDSQPRGQYVEADSNGDCFHADPSFTIKVDHEGARFSHITFTATEVEWLDMITGQGLSDEVGEETIVVTITDEPAPG